VNECVENPAGVDEGAVRLVVAPARFLEWALVFTIFAHAVGMVLMLPCLLPGLPGGMNTDIAGRAAWVAGHPWLWRLGWLAWQVTAASDVLLCVALVCARWVPKWAAVAALLVTLAAVVPDQSAQFSWTWRGVELAQEVSSDGVERYRAYEADVFFKTAGLGAAGYIVAACFWTWSFAGGARHAGQPWRPGLWRLSAVTWIVFGATTCVLFLPSGVRSQPVLVAAVGVGNAAAFVLLMVWFAWVGEGVFRWSRPVLEPMRGGWSVWRHPRHGLGALCAELTANSRLAQAFACALPSLAMKSDIRDVVYINYIVPAERLQPLVERPLVLRRVGLDGAYAVFSILTFRHGHFGPSCFGRLRRWWPSPVQSNWRIHVANPETGRRGIQFVTTAIASVPHALATRLLAEGVPMHVPESARVAREGDRLEVEIEPGDGSSPDLRASLHEGVFDRDGRDLWGAWAECFASWEEAVAYIVPQDRAMCSRWRCGEKRVVRQEIDLGIPLASCVPLEGEVRSMSLRGLIGEASTLCFVVRDVAFEFSRQEWDG
jgi:hypothetical protein